MRMNVSGLNYGEMMAVVEQLKAKAFSVVRLGENIFIEVAGTQLGDLSPSPVAVDRVCFSC